MKRYAMTTNEGTAAAETCLCEKHFNSTGVILAKSQAHEDVLNEFEDVTENEVLKCIICNK